MDSFCGLLVNKLKDAYGWEGEITLESSIGAWIGEVPEYLKETSRAKSYKDHIDTSSSLLEKLNEDVKASAQDIATYQVNPVNCVGIYISCDGLKSSCWLISLSGSIMEAGSVII